MKLGEKRLLNFPFFFRWDFFKIRGSQSASWTSLLFNTVGRKRKERVCVGVVNHAFVLWEEEKEKEKEEVYYKRGVDEVIV